MGWACSQDGRRQELFQNFTSEPAGKRSQGRPRRRLVDNIRIGLKEIGTNTRNWIGSV